MDSAEHIQDHPCRAVLPPSADPCAPEAAPMGTLAATAAAASTLTAVVEQPAAVEQCHDPSTPLAPADLSYRPKGAAALVKVASATAGTSMLPAATADTQQAPVAAAEQVSVPAPSSSLIPQQLQQQQVEVNASLDLFEIQGLISSDHSVGDIDQELVEDQDDPQQDVDMMDRDQDAGAMICSHICMVDGCDVDLTEMKPYFRRSKICPGHQTAAVVLVAGQECRFCQQCTRCHPLTEFDGTKRSCRSQLLHHNKSRKHRRRCTPGSFYTTKRARTTYGGVAKKKTAAAAAPRSTAKAAAAKAITALPVKDAAAVAYSATNAVEAALAVAAEVAAAAAMAPAQDLAMQKAAADSSVIEIWGAPAAKVARTVSSRSNMHSSSYCSRMGNELKHRYQTAAAAAASHEELQHRLMQQYSADTAAAAAAATHPMGGQNLLTGFRSLPSPNSMNLSAAAYQGSGDVYPPTGVLPQYSSAPGFNIELMSSSSLYNSSGQGFNSQLLQSQQNIVPSSAGYVAGAYQTNSFNLNPAVPGALTQNPTMGRAEDELNPSSSSCSSKGSPHMPPAARLITTLQQQQMNWQQQHSQVGWRQTLPNWVQQKDGSWRQQQQQQVKHEAVAVDPAAAAAVSLAPMSGLPGSTTDLLSGWPIAGLQQQLQQPYQQQQKQQQVMRPNAGNAYASAAPYKFEPNNDFWSDVQHMAGNARLSGSSNKLMLAQQLVQEAAAEAAAEAVALQQQQQQQRSAALAATLQPQPNPPRSKRSAGVAAFAANQGMHAAPTAMDLLQQQQQYVQNVLLQAQQQGAVIAHQQQQQQQKPQSSPDVSAGSTCAPSAYPCDIRGHPLAAAAAAAAAAKSAAAPVGYTTAPYNFNQQWQQQQKEDRGGYQLAPAEMVVGVDIYTQGLAIPGWTASGTQASGPGVLSSNPSDTTQSARCERQSSMTSQQAGASGVSGGVSGVLNPGSNPVGLIRQISGAAQTNSPNNPVSNQMIAGLDVPALAALMVGCLDSDAEDAWLLEACQAADASYDKAGDPLMETLVELGF